MSVALVHHFHTQTSTVENVCPGVQNTTLTINNGLIEVESVEVECHGADAEGGKPDSHDWATQRGRNAASSRIVKRCILENQTTEVTVSSDDVVGLFFLTELVTIVLGLGFGGLTNQRRGNQRTVHCTEQRSTEHTCYAEHVERVHQNVVLCLEDKHVVECTRNAKRHCVRERTLTERIYEEHSRSSSDRCAICNTDPRTHTQTIGKFPLTTHVSIDADEEVEDYELERTTIIQPLVE